MPIPESQLETWANHGAVTTAKATADSIKNVLQTHNWKDDISFEIFLQGSYKNDTNIRAESDVDIVIQFNSTFYHNLSEQQKVALGLEGASYSWDDFRLGVLNALKQNYGASNVSEGKKTIKLTRPVNQMSADVVVACQYRKYNTVNHSDYIEGICFWTKDSNSRQVINYPKKHYKNGVEKHSATNQWYKPTVRIFKNLRSYINDPTPSYFVESLIYNAPESLFGVSYGDTFCNIVNWLNKTTIEDFYCKNGITKLFGPAPEQWSVAEAKQLISAYISEWNNW